MALPTGGTKLDQMMTNCKCPKCSTFSKHHFGKKMIMTLAGILLVYLVFYVGTLIHSNIKKYDLIGQADHMERTITINGFGKVNGKNDIAVTTIGYSNTDKDIAKAQADNKKVMDQIYTELKNMGIAEKDLQSEYSVYPDYNYTQEKGQELKGYRVSNSLTIKIRDLSKIGNVLGLAGEYGANEVNGLNFTIDDPENLKSQARDKAVADAKAKAQQLANNLGVHLGSLVSYGEYDNSGDTYPLKYAESTGLGMGGAPTAAPASVSGGSMDVTMNVNLVYEISQ